MRFLPATLFVLLCLSVRAADWPQWRGPDRTGHVPAGAPVPATLPAEPKTLWHFKIGDGFSSPVVAVGKVFYLDNQGGQETLHCLDAADAHELWRADIDQAFTDNQGPSGPRCTPLVDGGRVYAQSCRGELRCLNAADGKPIWAASYLKDFSAVFTGEQGRTPGAGRHGNNGSPAIDGDQLLANVGGKNGESVVCFQKATGRIIWKSQNDPAAYAAPILATIAGRKQLVDFTVAGLIGLDPRDGQLLWRVPLQTSFGRHVTTPVICGDIVVVASHEIGLLGVKITVTNGGFSADRIWLNHDAAMNFSSPVAVGQYLYGLGPKKNLVCVDIKTGELMWSRVGYINTSADRSHAAFLVMGENILTLTDGGQLVLFAADPGEFKEISVAQVCGKTWCNPAYADGRLYLRDARELKCVNLLP